MRCIRISSAFTLAAEMKEIKGRFLKKLKAIPKVGALKTDRIPILNAPDALLDLFRPNSGLPFQKAPTLPTPPPQKPQEDIDIAQLLRDLGEEDEEFPSESHGNKENIQPQSVRSHTTNKSMHDPSNSDSVFDPDLLSAFKQLVVDHQKNQETLARNRYELELPLVEDEAKKDPLSEFPDMCPPGGSYSVILYTTTIRGIRKTFENCNRVRFLLGSLRVMFHERDLSMHSDYREELWRIFGARVVPPRLFIKGRCIGGADEVLTLHEQGKFRQLLADIPLDRFNGMCDECGGVRFLMCRECHGSRKLAAGEHEAFVRCLNCNENGLVICSLCC